MERDDRGTPEAPPVLDRHLKEKAAAWQLPFSEKAATSANRSRATAVASRHLHLRLMASAWRRRARIAPSSFGMSPFRAQSEGT